MFLLHQKPGHTIWNVLPEPRTPLTWTGGGRCSPLPMGQAIDERGRLLGPPGRALSLTRPNCARPPWGPRTEMPSARGCWAETRGPVPLAPRLLEQKCRGRFPSGQVSGRVTVCHLISEPWTLPCHSESKAQAESRKCPSLPGDLPLPQGHCASPPSLSGASRQLRGVRTVNEDGFLHKRSCESDFLQHSGKDFRQSLSAV